MAMVKNKEKEIPDSSAVPSEDVEDVEDVEDAEDVEDLEDSFEEEEASEMNASALLKQIGDLQSKLDAMHQEYLRAVADRDNYRKRVVREKDELRMSVVASIIESLFPVIDNLILGLEAAEKHEKTENIVKGFHMVLDQFRAVLGERGVKVLNPEGEAFNPSYHDCMSFLPSEDVAKNVVIEVVRVGYLLNERLLRPASVVVSKGSDGSAQEDPLEEGE